MGFFSKLAKATIDVVTLPVAVVKDVVTIGGLSTDQHEPYTVQKAKSIEKNLGKAYNKL